MLLLINSCNKRGNFFTSNMSFRMSSDDTVTCVSGEGPGPGPGGIARHTNADQSSEGPSLKTGGIAGSAVTGIGIKRKLDATVHSKCINDHTLRSDIFLPKCPTNLRVNTL
jgi:hypothetical protein